MKDLKFQLKNKKKVNRKKRFFVDDNQMAQPVQYAFDMKQMYKHGYLDGYLSVVEGADADEKTRAKAWKKIFPQCIKDFERQFKSTEKPKDDA